MFDIKQKTRKIQVCQKCRTIFNYDIYALVFIVKLIEFANVCSMYVR